MGGVEPQAGEPHAFNHVAQRAVLFRVGEALNFGMGNQIHDQAYGCARYMRQLDNTKAAHFKLARNGGRRPHHQPSGQGFGLAVVIGHKDSAAVDQAQGQVGLSGPRRSPDQDPGAAHHNATGVNQRHVPTTLTAVLSPELGEARSRGLRWTVNGALSYVLSMISDILAIIAPVMVIALIGYVWERRGMPFDNNMVTQVVINVGSPCLLLSSVLSTRPDLAVMARIAGAAILVLALTMAVAWAVLRALRQPLRVFLPVLVFGNTGNVGLPLCLFAFGPEGLALAVAYFATQSVLQFSIGAGIASGQVSWQSVFKSPALYAIIIGCAMISADVTLPRVLTNTVNTLAGLTIPLMLMSLGIALAGLRVVEFRRSMMFAVFRLAGGFALGLAAAWALGLEGAAWGAVVVQSTMPAAVFSYLFAARYGNRPEEVAGIVFISTILSFLSLPLLMAFVLHH